MQQIIVRLDEHGRRIDGNGKLIEVVARRQERLTNAIYGDAEMRYPGLLERQGTTEETVERLVDNWHAMEIRWETTLILLKISVAILSATGLGVWWPILKQILNTIP